MDFLYEPMTEEEALKEKFQLLEDGIYEAVVERATAKMSASNNPMIELVLNVYDKNGQSKPVYDFLLFSKNMMWKTIHFCMSAGLEKEYQEKKLKAELTINKNVKVKIITKKGNEIPKDKLNGKPVGSCYPDKNAIDDYVSDATSVATIAKSITPDFMDYTIPF